MQPKVTIITASRNLIESGRENVFLQCVDSVRMQDYPNIEHLVIDGASTDGTVELFNKLNLNYISEPDTGIYNAYNKGVKKASGKYVFFLNSDDRLVRSDAISDCVNKLENNNADITYSDVLIDNINGEGTEIRKANLPRMFLYMPFCHSTIVMKTSLIKELGGFDEQYKIAADYDLLWKAFLQKAKLVKIDKFFSSWRVGGISNTCEDIFRREYIDIFSKKSSLPKEQIQEMYNNNYIPYNILKRLLNEVPTFPGHKKIIIKNIIRMLKVKRRKLFTIRLSKNKQCLRLFGVTLFDR